MFDGRYEALAYNLRLSENEEDLEDKLDPSIQYLKKLGPEYINEVFKYSRWIFDLDSNMAFEVCTISKYKRGSMINLVSIFILDLHF
jgi:hypothetical protein